MKIIDIPGGQGSPAWLQWRLSKITGTAASVLMGHNPFKSASELWDEMMGMVPPMVSNAAMERGTRLEPEARELFCKTIGLEFVPIVCESDENPWQGSSLDGWCESENAILEIKCGSERLHNEAINGIVPLYYRDQVQHCLAVTGARICYYVSYRPEHEQKLAVVEIKTCRDAMDAITSVERDFYFNNLKEFRRPEEWKLKQR